MQIDWADPLSQSNSLAGLGDAGMGSWLSTFVANNQNTIAKVINAVTGAVLPKTVTPTTAAPAAPPPVAPPVIPANRGIVWSEHWPIMLAGAAVLLSLRK